MVISGGIFPVMIQVVLIMAGMFSLVYAGEITLQADLTEVNDASITQAGPVA